MTNIVDTGSQPIPATPTYSDLAAQLAAALAESELVRAERDAALLESERLVSVLEEWCADPPAQLEDDGGWVDVITVEQVQGLVDDWRKKS